MFSRWDECFARTYKVYTQYINLNLNILLDRRNLGVRLKSDQTHSGNNISSKHSAILQTYQRLFSCEWRATEKPKYSLSPVPLNTTADPISTLKPQIPTDWSKQTKAASSLYIFGLDAEGRSSLELYFCVAILNPLDLKPSTHLTSLPDIKSNKSWCQMSINPWKIGGGDDLWCRIRFNPLRWMTELSRSFPLSYLRFKSTNVLEARNWKVFPLFRRATPRNTEKKTNISMNEILNDFQVLVYSRLQRVTFSRAFPGGHELVQRHWVIPAKKRQKQTLVLLNSWLKIETGSIRFTVPLIHSGR